MMGVLTETTGYQNREWVRPLPIWYIKFDVVGKPLSPFYVHAECGCRAREQKVDDPPQEYEAFVHQTTRIVRAG